MRVAALHLFPIKSCAGIDVEVARVGPRGLERDRELLAVDRDGRFLTQREHARLALVEPRPARLAGREPCGWTLRAPGLDPLVFEATDAGERRPVTIWKDTVPAVDQGDDVARWLARALDLDGVRLVRMAQEHVRGCNPAWAPPGSQTGFADAYPALLASSSSLHDVSTRAGWAVPMARFRANVVVSGAEPWAEDGWRRLRIGPFEADVVKPCERCNVPSIDQVTATQTKEPSRTLASFRTHDGSRWPGLKGKVLFGQNVVLHGEGELRVGDAVEVLA